MHAASLEKSKRLKKVDDLLSDLRPRSTLEIIQQAGVCAVNSVISELRRNGRIINCHRHEGNWYYRRVS